MEHTQASELCLAAFSGNAKVVNMLLTTVGVDVNASDCGMNALVRASIAGKVDIVKLLLSHKADVNLADMYGDTPLHYACFCGFESVVTLLLEAGANVNALGGDGSSPLAAAESQGNSDVCALLVKAGGTSTPPDPAKVAARQALPRVTLATGFPSRVPPGLASQLASEGASGYRRATLELGKCATEGDVRGVHELLTLGGVDIGAVDEEGCTALHRAGAGGQFHAILLLLGHGADANCTDAQGCTPLHSAAQGGVTDCAHVLLAAGADPKAVNKAGQTPEQVARVHHKWGVSRLLCGTWTKVPNLDFSFGVVREGPVRLRRSTESFGAALFPWKSKYALLSRAYRALFIWSGSAESHSSAIVRLGVEVLEGVTCNAEKSLVSLTVRGGDPITLSLDSAEAATAWSAGFTQLLGSYESDAKKSALVTELLSDGSARRNMRGRLTRKERMARDALLSRNTRPRIVLSDLQAALLVQRAVRGHRIRNMVRGWVKIVAPDGDVYYHNVKTGASEWDAPWERRGGDVKGGVTTGEATRPPPPS